MDKVKYVKLEKEDGSFGNPIPLSVDGKYIDINGNSLMTELNSKATKEEVQAIASGSPAGTYATVAALTSADPNHSKIYLVIADGKWYYYNNGWQPGGVYQGTEVSDNAVSYSKLDDFLSKTTDNFNTLFPYNVGTLYFDGTLYGYGWNGSASTITTRVALKAKNMIAIDINKKIKYKYNANDSLQMGITIRSAKNYDSSSLLYDSGWLNQDREILLENYSTAKYISFVFRNKNNVSNVNPTEVNNFLGKIFIYDNIDEIDNFAESPQLIRQDLRKTQNYVFSDIENLNFKPDFLQVPHNRFVAHRGYSSIAPENTVPAFEEAGKAGFWGIETDIQETSDGKFVCLHNLTTEWATGENLTVTEATLEELRALTIINGNNINSYENLQIPTLEEFLEVCKKYDCIPFMDSLTFTSENAMQNFINIVDNYGFLDKCVMMALNGLSKLRAIRKITDRPTVLLLLAGWIDSNIDYFKSVMKELRNCGIGMDYRFIAPTTPGNIHETKSLFGAWTVDELSRAEELLNKGVDFVVTNTINLHTIEDSDLRSLVSHNLNIGNFMNGDMDLHGVYQNTSYRLMNIKINEAITDIKIIIPSNFRVYVHYYNKNGIWKNASGWFTGECNISAGSYYKLVIARSADVTSETIDKYLVLNNFKIYTLETYNLLNPIQNYERYSEQTIEITCRQGQVDNYPENTLQGFRRAKELGYDHIRLSFGWTSDGVPICCHDYRVYLTTLRNLDGTPITDQSLSLEQLTYEYVIENFDAGIYKGEQFAGISVPTVEEVLVQAKKLQQKVDIEFKFGFTEERLRLLLKMIYKYGMQDYCLYSTGHVPSIEYISSSIYPIDTALIANLYDNTAQQAVDLGCKRLDMFESDAYREDSVIIAHRGGVKVKFGSAYDLTTVKNVIDKYDVIEVANIENPLYDIINDN